MAGMQRCRIRLDLFLKAIVGPQIPCGGGVDRELVAAFVLSVAY